MPYHIAGIDVHKKMSAVAVADVVVEGDFHFERLKVRTSRARIFILIAEVGANAAVFPSATQLASWMGACPDKEESAGVNYSHRCPKTLAHP